MGTDPFTLVASIFTVRVREIFLLMGSCASCLGIKVLMHMELDSMHIVT